MAVELEAGQRPCPAPRKDVQVVRPYRLRIEFRDGMVREIDFAPVLAGALYAPLRDEGFFRSVRLDPEFHPIVRPSGADFDPATLPDWPDFLPAMAGRARAWRSDGTHDRVIQRTADDVR